MDYKEEIENNLEEEENRTPMNHILNQFKDDFFPKPERQFYKDIRGRKQFVREIARRTGFSMKDIKLVLDAIIDIFREAIDKQLSITLTGWMTMYHSILPARRGVNAAASKEKGYTVYQDYQESRRTILRLSEELRQNSKARFKESQKQKEK